MTATAHALVGGAIASSIQNPALGITLSAVSHPLLDMVPHWDFGWGWKQKTKTKLFIQALGDLIFGGVLAYILFGQNISFWYFLACVFLSEVWDMMEAPYWFLNWRFPPFSTIYNIQSKLQGKTKTVWGGIATQVISIILIVWVLNIV